MSIQDILKIPNGANFYFADLHIHTPADKCKDYDMAGEAKNTDDENWCRQYARKIIEQSYNKGLSIIGVTDHNSADWIDYFNEEVTEVSVPQGRNQITVFPGFEVNTNTGSGVHVICLFEPGTPKIKLDEYLSALFEAEEKFDTRSNPKLAKKTCNGVIEFVQERGGICIGAHALSNNGILSDYEGEPRVKAFTDPKLFAIEIPCARSELTGFAKKTIYGDDQNYKKERLVATINASDSDGLSKVGTKATYIKMSSLSIEGLREAFLDWESRVRLPDELKTETYATIIGIRWTGGDCFLDNQMMHFNKNLNTIIGGKGTGKSTIIETLRFAFDQKTKSAKAETAYNEIIKEVFKSGSTVQILVYSPLFDRHYLIERTYPGQTQIKSVDEQLLMNEGVVKEKQIIDLTIKQVLVPDIYGQKEVYDISEDPSFQLKLIDRFLDEEFLQLKEEEHNVISQLLVNKRELMDVIQLIDRMQELQKELTEIGEKKLKYAELKIDEKLDKQKKYEKESSLLKISIAKIDEIRTNIIDLFDTLDTDISFLEAQNIDDLPNKNIFSSIKEKLEKYFQGIDQKKSEIIDATDLIEKEIERLQTKWQPLYAKQQDEYKEILKNLREDGVPLDPEDYLELERRENFLKPKVENRAKHVKVKETVETKRKQLLDQLSKVRLAQFNKRKQVADTINTRLQGILKVDVKYAAIRNKFIDKILEYSTRENRIMHDPVKRMAEDDKFNVRLFVNTLRKGEEALIRDLHLTPGTAASIYRAIPTEDYYDIEILDFESETIIRLYLGPPDLPISERIDDLFRETKHLSKGQKCTAILTLILLESERPLIIDQPEDDLDNRFVVDDVVRRLRDAKESRQFIVATHNANIAIYADSEQIVALDADERHGWVQTSGSIDDQEVKEAVESILEGGKEVFLLRKEKYGF